MNQMVTREFVCRGWCLFVLVCLVSVIGCGPEYPKCDTSEDCKDSEKGQEEGRLICVNGKCQQCLEDGDCGDPSLECNAGSCDTIIGYCTAVSDCGANEKCVENRCKPECSSDQDCEDGQICKAGKCTTKPECSSDQDCPDGKVCSAEGTCIDAASDCSLEPIYFGYDESSLTSSAQRSVEAIASCIKDKKQKVRIEGHADERGPVEYNIALGERRARTVFETLRRLGVSDDSMSSISYGEEKPARVCAEDAPSSCHSKNRRVEVFFR